MKIPHQHRKGRASIVGIFAAMAAGVALWAVVGFPGFVGQPEQAPPSGAVAHVSAVVPQSDFIRAAVAAQPDAVRSAERTSGNSFATDSRLEDYRLERDSCCVGN